MDESDDARTLYIRSLRFVNKGEGRRGEGTIRWMMDGWMDG